MTCIRMAQFAIPWALSWLGFAQSPADRNDRAATKSGQSFNARDLSGVWTSAGNGLGRQPAVAPMTPWGEAKFDANKPSFGPRAISPALGNDPLGLCDPLGVPRIVSAEIFYGDGQIQFIQTPGRVLQLIQWTHVWRDIWTDGRPLPSNSAPRWMGYSIGRWEGDEFVIDSVGFDERTWVDELGDPHSEGMRLQERYHRVDPDTLRVTMVIDDPKSYTKPWGPRPVTYKRNPDPKAELEEIFCVPSDEQEFNKTVRDAAGVSKQGQK